MPNKVTEKRFIENGKNVSRFMFLQSDTEKGSNPQHRISMDNGNKLLFPLIACL